MVAKQFQTKYLEPMTIFLLEHKRDEGMLQAPLKYIADQMSKHIKKYYRNEQTTNGFYDRLLVLSSYYAYVEGEHTNYDEFVIQYTLDMEKVLGMKGDEYVDKNGKDRLQNFKLISEYNHRVNYLNVWFVYVMKHIISLILFPINNKQITEPIRQRCLDVANYCVLGKALQSDYLMFHSGFQGMYEDVSIDG